jgi:hypothetical protein
LSKIKKVILSSRRKKYLGSVGSPETNIYFSLALVHPTIKVKVPGSILEIGNDSSLHFCHYYILIYHALATKIPNSTFDLVRLIPNFVVKTRYNKCNSGQILTKNDLFLRNISSVLI